MSVAELKANFCESSNVPIVSGDPVDRPLNAWLRRNAGTPDVALVGIPFDGATVVPSRKGAAEGPAAVREALGDLNCYNLSLDIEFYDAINGIDLGDVRVDSSDSVREVHDRVSTQIASVIKSGLFPITIGGDDSLCFAGARALCNAVNGKVGVVGFDAHLDMRILYSDETASGSSYRRMFEELDGRIDPKNVVHIGGNGWFAAKEYADYARQRGVTLITADDVYEHGIGNAVREAVEKASIGTEAIYVNFDMDVLDQHYAPGKVMRNPGGLRGRDAYVAARLLGQAPKVRYFALNEVNPNRDVSKFTSLVGAYVIGHLLAGISLRQKAGEVAHGKR